MVRRGSAYIRRWSLISRLTVLGVVMLAGGGGLLGTSLALSVGASTGSTGGTTLSLTTSAPGASCNNSNPSAPICTGLAGGDVMNVAGTGFSPGATASIEQCNSDPTQPVIVFLGQAVPVSCSTISTTTIPSSGKNKGKLSGTKTLISGTVGPPINNPSSFPPTCNPSGGTPTTTSTIAGCSTSGNPVTDAANFPCPPTAAQQAIGDICVLAIGDTAGDRAIGTILFGDEQPPGSTTTTTSSSTSSTSSTSTSSTTSTSTSSTTSTSTSTSTTSTTSSTTTTTSPTSTTTTTPTSTTTLPVPTGPIGSFISSPSIQLGPSGSVSDSVVVVGNATSGSPTGSVNFYVCQIAPSQTLTTGPCPAVAGNHFSTSHLSGVQNNNSVATSATFTPAAAGTWCFSAVYGGSTKYAGQSDNTTGSNLDPNECVLVTTASSQPQSFTSTDVVTFGPSGTVNDEVTISGDVPNENPTGTVEFFVCQTGNLQNLQTGPCPATGTPEDPGEILVPGAGSTSSATSIDFTPTSPGIWCFSTVYGGDSNYNGSSDNTSAANLDPNECTLVTAAESSTATSVSSPTITLGPSGTVTDSVTVSGNSLGGSPTGSVDFYACQTGTTQSVTPGPCPASGTPTDTEGLTAQPGDNATATSAVFTPTGAGTWCFSAVYEGDSNYQSSADNIVATDLDPNECFIVSQASSTSATQISSVEVLIGPSGQVTDKVTVTGNTAGGAPTGSVEFYVCQTGTNPGSLVSGSCAASGTPESTESLMKGAGDASTSTSAAFSPSSAGTWCFSAVYGGDSNYTSSVDNTTAADLDPNECVLAQVPYTFTSADSSSATKGSSFSFEVTTAGTPAPKFKKKGNLPLGVRLTGGTNGTATISGTPKKTGTFSVTLYATFGTGKSKHVATQAFTLVVAS